MRGQVQARGWVACACGACVEVWGPCCSVTVVLAEGLSFVKYDCMTWDTWDIAFSRHQHVSNHASGCMAAAEQGCAAVVIS